MKCQSGQTDKLENDARRIAQARAAAPAGTRPSPLHKEPDLQTRIAEGLAMAGLALD